MRAWLSLIVLLPVSVAAQPANLAQQANLSRSDEMRLARSAAPVEITKDARIYVLDHDHYVVAEPGHSTMSCMVIRSGSSVVSPECGDAEADASALAVERFRTEERLAGRSLADIDQAVKDGLAAGRFRAPKRPALVYMMSPMQQLTNPAGKPIGKWMPHVMVYYPFLSDSDLGLVNTPDNRVPGTVDPGTAFSALVVVTPGFVDPGPTP
jgi:hypothetical protein